MKFIRNIIKEVSTLYGIMLYSILVNFFDASFLLVDVIMLGRLGKGHLSAAFLSFAFYNICWYLLEGMLTAEDNLLSRAFHLHDLVSVRYWTYISFIVVIILCLVTSILFIFSAIIIQFMFSIPQHIALKSAEFLFLLLPGFFFHALYRVVQKYLHSQQDTKIPLICGGIGVVSNIIGNCFFMLVCGLGFSGCGIATSIARLIMLVSVVYLTLRKEDSGISISRFSSEANNILRSLHSQMMNSCKVFDATRRTSTASNGAATHGRQHSWTKLVLDRRRKREVVRVLPAIDERDELDIELTDITVRIKDVGPSIGGQSDDIEGQADGKTDTDDSEAPLLSRGAASLSTGGSDLETRPGGTSVLSDTMRFILLGLPGAFILGSDVWIFDVVLISVASMGSVVIDAHQVLMTLTWFFFLVFPFSISLASSIRINKLLVNRKFGQARYSAWVSLLTGSVAMLLTSILTYVLRDFVGYVFSINEDVVSRMKSISIYNSAFQIVFGVYGSTQGILRATSHQLDVVGYTILALWLTGYPIGMYLCFYVRPTYGLEGLWLGIITGMSLLSLTLVLQVIFLDWEKEYRKVEFRLQRMGIRRVDNQTRTTGDEHDDEEQASVMSSNVVVNPMQYGIDSRRDVATLGSRGVAAVSLSDALRSSDEDLAELEFVEFGDNVLSNRYYADADESDKSY